jgi:hypothetical protein
MIYNTPGEHAKHYTTYAAKLMYMYYNNKSLPHIRSCGVMFSMLTWSVVDHVV